MRWGLLCEVGCFGVRVIRKTITGVTPFPCGTPCGEHTPCGITMVLPCGTPDLHFGNLMIGTMWNRLWYPCSARGV